MRLTELKTVESKCDCCGETKQCHIVCDPHDDWEETGDYDQHYLCESCMISAART